jgi:AcrR family transcriptional regulator
MKKDQIRSLRREEIFKAAIACFNENGYHKTSVDMICARAGITKRGLYYHFKSKDELFIELFHYRGRQYFDYIASCTGHVEDPLEKIRMFVNRGSSFIRQNEDFLRFFVEFMIVGARNPLIGAVLKAHYENSIENFKTLLRCAIDAGKMIDHDIQRTAQAVFISSMGIFFTYYTLMPGFNMLQQHNYDIDVILKSVCIGQEQ